MRQFPLSTLALCALTAGCVSSWEPQYGPAPQVVASQTGNTVRGVTRDRGIVELRNVQVLDDSIVGDSGEPPQRVALATSNVQVISVRKSNHGPTNTAIITAGVALVAIFALSLAWLTDLFTNPFD